MYNTITLARYVNMAARLKRRSVHVYTQSTIQITRVQHAYSAVSLEFKYYTYFVASGSNEKEFILRHYSTPLASTSWICSGDDEEANHHHSEPVYIPKWKRKTSNIPSDSKKCIYSI